MSEPSLEKFTKRAKQVLQLATEEARHFGHPDVGAEHLLLGMLREGEGLAARALNDLGVQLAQARKAVVELIGGRGEEQDGPNPVINERAKKVITYALEEAERLDHHYIGTEHLLLGLARLNEGVATGVLDTLQIKPEQIQTYVLRILRVGPNARPPFVAAAWMQRVAEPGVPQAAPARPQTRLSRQRIPIAILGATGAVGQRMIQLLQGHPWFEIVALTGSERTVGRPYGELVRWVLDDAPPPEVARMIVQPSDAPLDVALALSALPTDAAREVEPRWAERVAVCSNASTYRMTPDVPLLIPEVNPDHLALIERQQAERGWMGCLVTNPNCAAIGIVMALKPLHDAFGVQKVHAATLQAVSGAGYPGVASLDIIDNIIPNIADGGEEAKVESEPRKLLGRIADGQIVEAPIAISAQVSRVPVIDGHTALLSIGFERRPTVEEAIAALERFQAPEPVRGLPSAPAHPLIVRRERDRPQPRRDRDAGAGMSASIGRVRECPLLDLRLVVLAHNTIRGAAGGALLNAELLVASGIVA